MTTPKCCLRAADDVRSRCSIRSAYCFRAGLLVAFFVWTLAAAGQPGASVTEFQRVLDRARRDYLEPTGFSVQELAQQDPAALAITLGYAIRLEFPDIADDSRLSRNHPALANDVRKALAEAARAASDRGSSPDSLWRLTLDAVNGEYNQLFEVQDDTAAEQGFRMGAASSEIDWSQTEAEPDFSKWMARQEGENPSAGGRSRRAAAGPPPESTGWERPRGEPSMTEEELMGIVWGEMARSGVVPSDGQSPQTIAEPPPRSPWDEQAPPVSPKLIKRDDSGPITLFGVPAQGVGSLSPGQPDTGEVHPDMIAGTWIEARKKDRMVIQPQGNNTYVGRIVAIGKAEDVQYGDRSIFIDRTYVFTFSGSGTATDTSGKAAIFAARVQSPMPKHRDEWRDEKAAVYYKGELVELAIGGWMTGEQWQRRAQ